MTREALLDGVVERALAEVAERGIRIHTIAMCHDFEGQAISVYVDTRDNSEQQVRQENRYSMKHCLHAIEISSLREATSWQANVGRNLSLGDFAATDLARTEIPPGLLFWRTPRVGIMAMAQALMRFQEEIRRLSLNPVDTILACSGQQEDIELVWALPDDPT
jgi:hypothetical protein